MEDLGKKVHISEYEPEKYWEIRLAWSEYVDGKWSPKNLSKEYVNTRHDSFPKESVLRLIANLDLEDKEDKLDIYITTLDETPPTVVAMQEDTSEDMCWHITDVFHLSDIASKINASEYGGGIRVTLPKFQSNGWTGYELSFMNFSKYSNLEILDNVYLKNEVTHRLLLTPTRENFIPTLKDPFFLSDVYRTYFIRPVDIKILEGIKHPNQFDPYTPKEESESVYTSHHKETPGATNGSACTGALKGAFGGDTDKLYEDKIQKDNDNGLEFHTFYHPCSNKYVTRLNQGGLLSLMKSDTEIASDDGETFIIEYAPNFDQGRIQPSTDEWRFKNHNYTFYKENVCFDPYGANSLYNWELFLHAPLYIATRLSKNGKYEEAMKWFHYIFDPTTDEMPGEESEITRYWKVLPFKTTPAERLEDWFRELPHDTDPNSENAIIGAWRENPFDPHLVAGNRPLAYMKHVVIKYVENFIAWGDSLFRQFTRESVNEALQIYVIANHILGPRPEFVPKRGEIKAESYDSLKDKWDDFSNALVELENIFPYSSEVSVSDPSTGTSLIGVGSTLYFCIPANDKLLKYWDTAADRLFKIRHCQDIEGVERKLALFAPPLSPEALIQAASQGLSLGSILADLSSPPPIYRFPYLIQKANEFCADVKALGSALLAALEKKDAEELSRMRASHETQMLELMTAIRERQVLDAKVHKENLLKARETASFRLEHYAIDLLGNASVTIPAAPEIIAETLTADSQLPLDTDITLIETDVDVSLEDSDERGVKLIPREKSEIDLSQQASNDLASSHQAEIVAGFLGLIPQFDGEGTPMGVGAGSGFGGRELSWFAGSMAKSFAISSQLNSMAAAKSTKMASYIRREQDWTLQANLAAKEIIQLDKQITSADIRIQVAEKELENHKQQIENAKEVELFLNGKLITKPKFTNQELYQWMKEQLFAVYKQSYNLAYDMARKAEKAYQYEMGTETANFIQYGYWDNSKQGLVSGEKLQLALRQLEKSYLEENRRELELTKSISLAMLNPLALIQFRETGKCYVSLPEEFFDLDFQGHYLRRIKSVSLSIPCIVGPYTNVNCSLRLLNNTIRINTNMGDEGYQHNHDEGLWIDDDRFRTNYVPVTSIATSRGQNDAGMFEFNFRDERYLPFEGAGAISDWQFELGGANFEADDGNEVLRQFDYSTISDVILHLNYTAREQGGLFKENALSYIKSFIMNTAGLADQPLMRMYSMKHEFPTEWHRFLHPATEDAEQVLIFTLGKERFPFFAQERKVVVMQIEMFVKCTQTADYDGDYHVVLSYANSDGDPFNSPDDPEHPENLITLLQNVSYGGINKVTINVNDAGLQLDQLDITKEMSIRLKRGTARNYTSLATEPDEMDDIFLVFHYKLSDITL